MVIAVGARVGGNGCTGVGGGWYDAGVLTQADCADCPCVHVPKSHALQVHNHATSVPKPSSLPIVAVAIVSKRENLPLGHISQLLPPIVDPNWPLGHAIQGMPALGLYLPHSQSLQPQPPGVELLPTGHASQLFCPATEENVPSGQNSQSPEPSGSL